MKTEKSTAIDKSLSIPLWLLNRISDRKSADTQNLFNPYKLNRFHGHV
jgi:hypothetical protein